MMPTADHTDPLHREVLAVIRAEIQRQVPEAVVTEETDITRDLPLDSVAIMDMVFTLEEKFDLSVPMHDLAEIYTVGALAALVCRLKTAHAA